MGDIKAKPSVDERITQYLSAGGLFNPELANHDAVRDLLIDARELIRSLVERPVSDEVEAMCKKLQALYCLTLPGNVTTNYAQHAPYAQIHETAQAAEAMLRSLSVGAIHPTECEECKLWEEAYLNQRNIIENELGPRIEALRAQRAQPQVEPNNGLTVHPYQGQHLSEVKPDEAGNRSSNQTADTTDHVQREGRRCAEANASRAELGSHGSSSKTDGVDGAGAKAPVAQPASEPVAWMALCDGVAVQTALDLNAAIDDWSAKGWVAVPLYATGQTSASPTPASESAQPE